MLIVVLWWLVILSIMAVALSVAVAPRLDLAARLRDRTSTYYLARAAVEISLIAMAADETAGFDAPGEAWMSSEKLFRERPLGRGRFSLLAEPPARADGPGHRRYGLADEERRINLNRASLDVLGNLFVYAGGMPALEASAVAACIVDWRDEDDKPEPSGAEATYYKTLSPRYTCKNAPFDVAEELLLIKGMTTELFARIEDSITLHGRGAVNINSASPLVLRGLGLSSPVAEKIAQYRNGPDGKLGTEDDAVFESVAQIGQILADGALLSQGDVREVKALVNSRGLSVRSDNFRGHAVAELDKHRGSMHIMFVLNRNGSLRYWREF